MPKQTRYTAEEPTSCSQSVPPGRCWHSTTEKGTWQAQWLMGQGCWCVQPAPPNAHGIQHIQTFNTPTIPNTFPTTLGPPACQANPASQTLLAPGHLQHSWHSQQLYYYPSIPLSTEFQHS